MRQLIDVLKEQKTPVFEGGEGLKGMSWNETVKYWLKKYPVCRKEFLEKDDSKKANVYAFIKEIGDRAKENQITVVGNGSACSGWRTFEYNYKKKAKRFISNSAVASMGYDLPARNRSIYGKS